MKTRVNVLGKINFLKQCTNFNLSIYNLKSNRMYTLYNGKVWNRYKLCIVLVS